MYKVHLDVSKSYDIFIGSGLIEKAGAFLSGIFPRCRIAVITDSNVYPLYAEKLGKSLTENGYEYDTFVFPAGEQSKNLSTLSDILEFMADHQLTRSDFVIALGGGVTGDMAGFAAAVYARTSPPLPSNIPPKYRVTTITASVNPVFLITSSTGIPAVPAGSPSSL